jgi:hypothetical protein
MTTKTLWQTWDAARLVMNAAAAAIEAADDYGAPAEVRAALWRAKSLAAADARKAWIAWRASGEPAETGQWLFQALPTAGMVFDRAA